MARLADQIQVKISDHGSEAGRRKVTIEIDVASEMFALSDALSREGIVKELGSELRSVVRVGVTKYVQESRELIRRVGESGSSTENGKAR